MVKGKIEVTRINNPAFRLKCFKKRRLGILKKAMQLELITGCTVKLQIINNEDNSLINYGFISQNIDCGSFNQFAKMSNNDYDFLTSIETQIHKYGHLNEEDEIQT